MVPNSLEAHLLSCSSGIPSKLIANIIMFELLCAHLYAIAAPSNKTINKILTTRTHAHMHAHPANWIFVRTCMCLRWLSTLKHIIINSPTDATVGHFRNVLRILPVPLETYVSHTYACISVRVHVYVCVGLWKFTYTRAVT